MSKETPENSPLTCGHFCFECGHKIHPATPERYARASLCSAACWADLHGERHDDECDNNHQDDEGEEHDD